MSDPNFDAYCERRKRTQLYLRMDYPSRLVDGQAFGHARVSFVFDDTTDRFGFGHYSDGDQMYTSRNRDFAKLVLHSQIDESRAEPYAVELRIEDDPSIEKAARRVKTGQFIQRHLDRLAQQCGPPSSFGSLVRRIGDAVKADHLWCLVPDLQGAVGVPYESLDFRRHGIEDVPWLVDAYVKQLQKRCREMAGVEEVA